MFSELTGHVKTWVLVEQVFNNIISDFLMGGDPGVERMAGLHMDPRSSR